jgi:putative transcriptional regulator
MAVRFRLDELLEERASEFPTQAELARRSGLSTVTVNAITQNRTQRVDLGTIDKLVTALHCKPGDLFKYVPDRGAKRGR